MMSRFGFWSLALVVVVLLALLPFGVSDLYQLHLVTLIAAYWILISGLNLVVGFTGQISIGHVGLLAIGAYTFSILAGTYGIDPFLALIAAGALGAICGLLLGLPSLRLPGFYFAMATLAFALIVGELSIALKGLTGGGVGLPVPLVSSYLVNPRDFYWFVLAVAILATWLSWNIARRMWGRALIAIRDSEVAAAASGVSIFRSKLFVFTFSGFMAGISGALFGSLQSYITPDTFIFELGLFFFVCIIIGGRGSIVGPLIGTVVLTALPDMVAPLARLGNFFYGALLLVVVLVLPEGISNLVTVVRERMGSDERPVDELIPDPARLKAAVTRSKT